MSLASRRQGAYQAFDSERGTAVAIAPTSDRPELGRQSSLFANCPSIEVADVPEPPAGPVSIHPARAGSHRLSDSPAQCRVRARRALAPRLPADAQKTAIVPRPSQE